MDYNDYYPIDPDTPLWEETMKATHVNPDEPMEMWRAYGDLKFLTIRINTPADPFTEVDFARLT